MSELTAQQAAQKAEVEKYFKDVRDGLNGLFDQFPSLSARDKLHTILVDRVLDRHLPQIGATAENFYIYCFVCEENSPCSEVEEIAGELGIRLP